MNVKQIVLTEKCNLNCSYCYIDQKDNMMTEDVFLEHFQTFNSDYTIDLFGGEPLINWSLIEFITKTCLTSSRSRCMGINLYSNGLLLDEEKVKFIKDNGINFFWSYDGLWAEETLPKDILNFVKELTNYVSVQIGPPNLNIVENYRYFVEGIQMTPTFTVMKDKRWNWDDIDRFRSEFRNMCSQYINYFRDGKNYLPKIIYITLKRLIEGMRNKTSYRFCGAGEGMNCYMPDGSVYPCARFGTEGTTNSDVDYSGCKECDLDHYCDKGCYHQGILDEVCELNRIVFTCAIELNNILKENSEWGKTIVQIDKEVGCIE